MKQWIGVDLDGTLAEYITWKGESYIGKPITKMMKRVKAWIAQGKAVKIFTARASDKKQIPFVKKWLKEQGLEGVEVTNIKDYGMTEFWDDKAHRVKKNTGELVKAQPTQAQAEAGNYKKQHILFQGLDISIENRKGSVRSGVDKGGNKWSIKMKHAYGYIKGTVGKDKDHLDVFIGDDKTSEIVFIINQIVPKTGAFDEHKIMLGFTNSKDAKAAYLVNYDKNWRGLGNMKMKTMETFKEWIKGDTTMMAKSIKGRAGLTAKKITDRTGKRTTVWIRSDKPQKSKPIKVGGWVRDQYGKTGEVVNIKGTSIFTTIAGGDPIHKTKLAVIDKPQKSKISLKPGRNIVMQAGDGSKYTIKLIKRHEKSNQWTYDMVSVDGVPTQLKNPRSRMKEQKIMDMAVIDTSTLEGMKKYVSRARTEHYYNPKTEDIREGTDGRVYITKKGAKPSWQSKHTAYEASTKKPSDSKLIDQYNKVLAEVASLKSNKSLQQIEAELSQIENKIDDPKVLGALMAKRRRSSGIKRSQNVDTHFLDLEKSAGKVGNFSSVRDRSGKYTKGSKAVVDGGKVMPYRDAAAGTSGGVPREDSKGSGISSKPPTAAKIKETVGADAVTVKNGIFKAMWGYFYTHGTTAADYAQKVKVALPNAMMVDSGQHHAPFKGGVGVSKSSHFWVKFKLK